MSERKPADKADQENAGRIGPALPFAAIMSVAFALGLVSTMSLYRMQQFGDAGSCLIPDRLDGIVSDSPCEPIEAECASQVGAGQDAGNAGSEATSPGSGAAVDVGATSSEEGEGGRSDGSAGATGCVDDGSGFIPSDAEKYCCDPSDDPASQGNASVADGANRPDDGAGSMNGEFCMSSESATSGGASIGGGTSMVFDE